MSSDAARAWRTAERQRLLAAREALDPDTLDRLRRRIDAHLERAFPGLASASIAFCWPIRGEYDARPLMERLRDRGAITALPVVVARDQPLTFRVWAPGVALARDAFGIPSPVSSAEVRATVLLLPVVGWDDAGYRLGYGGGAFDRTLAGLAPRPTVIGVGYELSKLATIHPQAWDVPLDWLVTERGVYRRDPGALAFLGEPTTAGVSAVSSPVCYASELDPEARAE